MTKTMVSMLAAVFVSGLSAADEAKLLDALSPELKKISKDTFVTELMRQEFNALDSI